MNKGICLATILLLYCLSASGTLLASGNAVVSTEHATVTLLSEQVTAGTRPDPVARTAFRTDPALAYLLAKSRRIGQCAGHPLDAAGRLGDRSGAVAGAEAHTGRAADQLWL